jgi:hypothetical protein
MGPWALAAAWPTRHAVFVRLEILTAPAHRGETVRARLELDADARAEVGLLCVSTYPETMPGGSGQEEPTLRETVTHQRWVELEPNVVEQIVDLAVPEGGPYSYEGADLAFSWRVVARSRRRFAPSETVQRPLLVLP